MHEFVNRGGLDCLIDLGSVVDQNYQNYILRGSVELSAQSLLYLYCPVVISVVTVSHLARSVDFGSVLRKERGFGTVRFSFYYAATVCGYGAGRGGDKISQMMGGGWARSVGGLSQ